MCNRQREHPPASKSPRRYPGGSRAHIFLFPSPALAAPPIKRVVCFSPDIQALNHLPILTARTSNPLFDTARSLAFPSVSFGVVTCTQRAPFCGDPHASTPRPSFQTRVWLFLLAPRPHPPALIGPGPTQTDRPMPAGTHQNAQLRIQQAFPAHLSGAGTAQSPRLPDDPNSTSWCR